MKKNLLFVGSLGTWQAWEFDLITICWDGKEKEKADMKSNQWKIQKSKKE